MTHTVDAQESKLLQELAQLRAEFPSLDPHLFPALQQLAKFYFDEHRFNEARPLLNEALEIRIQALGENHFQVAESLCHLAALAAALHEHVQSINLLKQSEQILKGYGNERREQLATVLNQLVESLFAESQYTEATDFAKRALELQGGNIHAATPEVTRTRNNLAALHVARGEYYLAARLLKLNVQVMKCDNKVSEMAVSTALNNLAEVFRLQGQLKEAWHQAVKALWSRRRSLGRQHPMVAQSWANLAAIRFDEGKYAAAESLFRRALAIRKIHSANHPALYALTLRCLAEVVLAAGRAYEAETIYRQAAEIYEQSFGPNDSQLALTLTYLGRLHIECGQHGSAQQVLARAAEIQDSRRKARDPAIAFTFNTFGSLHAARAIYDQAEDYHRRALDVQRAILGKEHPDVATTLIMLGDATFALGKHADAETSYRKALQIRRQQFGERHRSVAEGMHRLAKLMVAEGEPDRAIELCAALTKRHSHTLELVPALHADTLGTLADAHMALDQLDFVEQYSREELALREPHQQARPGESLPAFGRLTKHFLRRKQFEEALANAQPLVAFAERLHGANHPNMIPYVEQIAEVYASRGQAEETHAAIERALKLRDRKYGAASDEVMQALERFGNLLYEVGMEELSSDFFTRASNIRDRNSHALFV